MHTYEPPLAPPERRRQAIALLALGAGVAYLTWRWGFTLRPSLLWLGLPLLLAETWALLSVALFVFSAWRLTERRPPAAPGDARVAVLVPSYNEPEEILRATVLGARAVRHDPAPEVYVLDDGDREWVAALAAELGAHYIVRPAPRTHAKAGNLNHALGLVDAEYLLVLDADHVPFPHFVERTLGYLSDPDVAFVQSPQAFFNRSFQHSRRARDPISNEQSLFYDVICRGKDRDNAVFWCGSSALLRRSALLAVGGVTTDTVVEDTHTAMKLHERGWKSVYHDEVLAVGLAPEEVNAFLAQRGRWAKGCFQLLRRENPLLARGLTWRQRLHYFSSVTHYLEGPQRLIGALVPPLTLLTGTVPLSAPPALYLSLFLPQLVLVPLATRVMARGRYRFVESDRFALVRMVTYTAAAKALFTRKRVAFAVTPKGAQSRGISAVSALRVHLLLAVLTAAGVVYQATAQLAGLPGRLSLFASTVTIAWCLVNGGLIGATVLWAARVRHRRRAHRFPVELEIRYATLGPAPAVGRGAVSDLSPFGLGMRASGPLEPGDRLRLSLPLDGATHSADGTVTVAVRGQASTRVGVAFDELAPQTKDAILSWCFQRPFGPAFSLGAEGPIADEAHELRESA